MFQFCHHSTVKFPFVKEIPPSEISKYCVPSNNILPLTGGPGGVGGVGVGVGAGAGVPLIMEKKKADCNSHNDKLFVDLPILIFFCSYVIIY
jgi:hypothetical protein